MNSPQLPTGPKASYIKHIQSGPFKSGLHKF